MVVAVGAMVLALLVALACFVWLGPQEKRAAAAATASRVASLFWLSGGAGLVSEGEHQRRQVHGYFWATDPDGRGSANASAAEGIAREFARSLSEHPGLLDALVVVHAVRTRVVIDSDDAALSYMLVEPLHTDPADSLRGIPPPALDALWREARRQGIKLYGGYVCMYVCICVCVCSNPDLPFLQYSILVHYSLPFCITPPTLVSSFLLYIYSPSTRNPNPKLWALLMRLCWQSRHVAVQVELHRDQRVSARLQARLPPPVPVARHPVASIKRVVSGRCLP